MQEGKFEK